MTYFTADDQSRPALHEIEFRTNHCSVVAESKRFWCRRVDGKKLREHLEFTPHVVSSFDRASEWRSTKHKLVSARLDQICKIRTSGRELFDRDVGISDQTGI